jgi:integrase
MAADGMSAAMRHKVGVTLGAAVRLRLMYANPARDGRKPRLERKEMKALTDEQLRAVLAAAAADRLYALYVLALDTGCRQGELLGLEWQDVDFGAGCLHVRRALREVKGRLSVGPPKTAQGRRRIDLTRFALEALNVHRAAMLAEGHYRLDAPVFCAPEGGHLRKSNLLRRSFFPILERSGLPDIRFHDLRHTVATQLLTAGEGVKVVSERLGHANSSMTLNIYAHVVPGAQARAAARLDRILRPAAPPQKTG